MTLKFRLPMRRPLWNNKRGNIAIITALMMIPLTFAMGMAYDYTMAESRQDQINGMADVATLAGVTPTLMGAGESDTARDARVARALYGMLAHDEEHGEENQATMKGWLKEWTPKSLEAGRVLQPIWSQPGEKVIRFEESLEHSQRRFDEILADFNLDSKELV